MSPTTQARDSEARSPITRSGTRSPLSHGDGDVPLGMKLVTSQCAPAGGHTEFVERFTGRRFAAIILISSASDSKRFKRFPEGQSDPAGPRRAGPGAPSTKL
eukprot:675729-Hanusia_phi.AAC.3